MQTYTMIDSTQVSAADLLLQDADFPDNYTKMQHPEDYIVVSKPFVEYIPHFHGHNNRLIVRVCWKISNEEYIPVSFVCDTGAPMGMYLSDKCIGLLRQYNRVQEDETGNEYANVCNVGKAAVEPTPPGHAPANIIGLRLLVKLGLALHPDSTFVLSRMPDAF